MTGTEVCSGCGETLDMDSPGVYTHVRRVGRSPSNDSPTQSPQTDDSSVEDAADASRRDDPPADAFLCEACYDAIDASVVSWESDGEVAGTCPHCERGGEDCARVAVTPTHVTEGRVSGSTHVFRLCPACHRRLLNPVTDAE